MEKVAILCHGGFLTSFNLKLPSSDTKQKKKNSFTASITAASLASYSLCLQIFALQQPEAYVCFRKRWVSLLDINGKMWINWVYYKLKTISSSWWTWLSDFCHIFKQQLHNHDQFFCLPIFKPSSALKFRAGQSLAKFSLIIRDSFKIHKLKKLDSVSIGLSRHLSRALCACNWASMTYVSCLWRKDRLRFPWIFCKTAAIGAVSIEIQSKRIVIFFRRKPTRKFERQNKTKR